MSAHLQFGPEWMRKGPGSKTPTTPSNEASFALSPPSSDAVATAVDVPAASKGPGSSARRNTSQSHVGPAPVTSPSTVLPSPGAFSFAAAASGASASPSGGGGAAASSASDRLFGGDGDTTRYSKRLLSLYSTERGPSTTKSPAASASDPAPMQSTTAASTATAPATQTTFGRRKNFESREPGRRSQSINTDVANTLNGRTFPLTASDGRPDSQRPGLFQRGSSSTNMTSTSPTTAVSPTFPQQYRTAGERERLGSVGIQGGVLSGVTPAAARRALKESVGGETSSGQANGATETDSHAPASRDTWARLRRERLPGEGPIGPPTDHGGGVAKGFDRRRERQTSVRYTAPQGEPPAVPRSAPTAIDASPSVDDNFGHHAATLVQTLKLDDDDDDDLTAAMSQADRTPWSAETAEWYYRDPSGQVQGPFKADMMQSWYSASYFSNDLLVRRAEASTYTPLGSMLQIIGNSVNPFLVPPSQYAQASATTDVSAFTSHPRLAPVQANAAGWASSPSISPAVVHDFGLANGGRQSPFASNPALSALAGGRSSPYATPPASMVDLDGHRQQNDYLAMIRQRELAEQHHLQQQQRLLQEQRNAQLAAIAMAQQGRTGDLGGGWNHSNGSEWGASASHIHQPLQNHTQQHQAIYNQQAYAQEPTLHESNQPVHVQQEPVETPADITEEQQQEAGEGVQETAIEASKEDDEDHASADKRVTITIDTDPADGADKVGEEMVDETSPERLWPQSPSAVEFASEPSFAAADTTPSYGDEMTVVKNNKKSRRAAAANNRSNSAQIAADSSDAPSTNIVGPGGLSVVSEAQFRRGQSAGRIDDSSTWTPEEAQSGGGGGGGGTPTKAAPWANSSGGTGSESLSLREIQEIEARRVQALKAAQQQQQRAAISSSSSSDLPLNMSWGLASVPSSAQQSQQQQSAQGSAGAASSSAPVWNASGVRAAPLKKTLTEIQEEERKRAMKAAAAAASQTTPAGRGYADFASKTGVASLPLPPSLALSGAASMPSQQEQQSGWAVVGAGGKPNPASTASPTVTAATMARTGSSGQARAALPRSASSGGAAAATQPSASFMRYCKEQLKGLNVKLDDFIEMLLSFPLDPSPDVVEIIAESVYANSSTLDGRRFAADFVAKRKQDVAAQLRSSASGGGGGEWSVATNGSGGKRVSSAASAGRINGSVPSLPLSAATTGTPRSASDVLRAPPARNASGEGLGGFKMVKAKGAKKRT